MNTKNLFWRFIKIILIRLDITKQGLVLFLTKLENNGGLIVREIHGSKMYLDPNDEGISRDLLFDRTREEKSTKEFKNILKKGMSIVDIGANIGYYVLMESKIIGNKGMVYAIEPVPKNIEMLKKSVALNDYKNIKISQKALGDKDGEVNFYLSDKSNLGGIVKSKHTGDSEVIKVELTTLDNYLKGKGKIDFVRMDTEGSEYEILNGMKQILKTKNLGLFIEIHQMYLGMEKTIEILELLKKNGFNECILIRELTPKLRWVSRFVPEKVLPKHEYRKTTIDKLINNIPDYSTFQFFAQK